MYGEEKHRIHAIHCASIQTLLHSAGQVKKKKNLLEIDLLVQLHLHCGKPSQ